VAFSIKKMDDGYKIVDGAEKELLRLKAKSDKLKFKDAADKELGYVTTTSPTKFKLKDPTQQVTYFAFQQQEDGDWKLEDEAGALIYKIKKRDYGWEVKDAAEAE